MQRFRLGLVTAVVLGTTVPAVAQDTEKKLVGILTTGGADGTPGGKATWTIANPDFAAIALTQFIASGVTPSGPGWGHLAMAGQTQPLTTGTFDTPLVLPLGNGPITFYGGNVPPGMTFPGGPVAATDMPSVGGGLGSGPSAAAQPLAGSAAGLPVLGLQLRVPESGTFGEIAFDLKDSTGELMRANSLTVPDGGWWSLEIQGTGFPPDTGPTVPEPGTLSLAGLGVLAAIGWRRLRRG